MDPFVAEFQVRHDRYDGRPLAVDGNMGPQTRWAMAVAQLPRQRRDTVQRAVRGLGVQERTGANDHPFIAYLLQRCGLGPGHAWCAAFASWALELAAPRQALARVLALKDMFGAIEPGALPLAGDLMWFPTGPSTGHCGIVIGSDETLSLCIEGNSDNRCRLTRREHSEVLYRVTGPARDSFSSPWPGIPGSPPIVAPNFHGTR